MFANKLTYQKLSVEKITEKSLEFCRRVEQKRNHGFDCALPKSLAGCFGKLSRDSNKTILPGFFEFFGRFGVGFLVGLLRNSMRTLFGDLET